MLHRVGVPLSNTWSWTCADNQVVAVNSSKLQHTKHREKTRRDLPEVVSASLPSRALSFVLPGSEPIDM
ncbi:MAG: hypothetical protein CMJ70_00940 [Planctomycetaceae bacterium]|nr:hypothetical protein [Planctomycetaceae bacterium]HAA70616.1 hypothetical protein [Planctomycetaceae bacterium]